METELWPNFLRECKLDDIPVALVNGRISRQSFRRYRLIKFFLRRVLSSLSIAVMQSETDAERLEELGMPKEKLFTAGNLKFDAELGSELTAKPKRSDDDSQWIQYPAHSRRQHTRAGRTNHPRKHSEAQTQTIGVRLMLAPRHPERFNEVAGLLQKSGLKLDKENKPARPERRRRHRGPARHDW